MDTQDRFNKVEEHQVFSAGQTIFQEGEPGNVLYILVEGQVDILINGQLLETLGPGDILGEMALIEDRPRSATAIARTNSLLTPITRQHFLTLIQRTPLFAIQVMRVLASRLRRTNLQALS
ncbi:MAG: cyclic nucleotide-binding domain-containing protein [Candidatus Competibacteraceae bacterium]|jgi:CRP/FNR family cyclic AMP-dependent transcriptional regulator